MMDVSAVKFAHTSAVLHTRISHRKSHILMAIKITKIGAYFRSFMAVNMIERYINRGLFTHSIGAKSLTAYWRLKNLLRHYKQIKTHVLFYYTFYSHLKSIHGGTNTQHTYLETACLVDFAKRITQVKHT